MSSTLGVSGDGGVHQSVGQLPAPAEPLRLSHSPDVDTAGSALIGLAASHLPMNPHPADEEDAMSDGESALDGSDLPHGLEPCRPSTTTRGDHLKRLRAAALTLSMGLGGAGSASADGSRRGDDDTLDDEDDGTGSGGRAKKVKLPDDAVKELKAWLLSPEHIDFPYPTDEEKKVLADKCGITIRQLTNWFTNGRKRIWIPLRRQEGRRIVPYAQARAVQRMHELATYAGRRGESNSDYAPASAPLPKTGNSLSGGIGTTAAAASPHAERVAFARPPQVSSSPVPQPVGVRPGGGPPILPSQTTRATTAAIATHPAHTIATTTAAAVKASAPVAVTGHEYARQQHAVDASARVPGGPPAVADHHPGKIFEQLNREREELRRRLQYVDQQLMAMVNGGMVTVAHPGAGMPMHMPMIALPQNAPSHAYGGNGYDDHGMGGGMQMHLQPQALKPECYPGMAWPSDRGYASFGYVTRPSYAPMPTQGAYGYGAPTGPGNTSTVGQPLPQQPPQPPAHLPASHSQYMALGSIHPPGLSNGPVSIAAAAAAAATATNTVKQDCQQGPSPASDSDGSDDAELLLELGSGMH